MFTSFNPNSFTFISSFIFRNYKNKSIEPRDNDFSCEKTTHKVSWRLYQCKNHGSKIVNHKFAIKRKIHSFTSQILPKCYP